VIVFDIGALDDVERIFEFNAHTDPQQQMIVVTSPLS
jgi:hypothetical protein